MLVGTRHTACEMMGPFLAPSLESARRLVKNFADRGTPDAVELLARHISQTGECVWHAAAEVFGKPCGCTPCANPRDPRHPWSIDSIARHREALGLSH